MLRRPETPYKLLTLGALHICSLQMYLTELEIYKKNMKIDINFQFSQLSEHRKQMVNWKAGKWKIILQKKEENHFRNRSQFQSEHECALLAAKHVNGNCQQMNGKLAMSSNMIPFGFTSFVFSYVKCPRISSPEKKKQSHTQILFKKIKIHKTWYNEIYVNVFSMKHNIAPRNKVFSLSFFSSSHYRLPLVKTIQASILCFALSLKIRLSTLFVSSRRHCVLCLVWCVHKLHNALKLAVEVADKKFFPCQNHRIYKVRSAFRNYRTVLLW